MQADHLFTAHIFKARYRKRMPLRIFISKLLIFSLVILSIANIYLVAHEFTRNYSNRTGIVLQNEQVLGGDFIAFYTAGILFSNDRGSLYQYEKQREVQKSLYEGVDSKTSFLSFAYPPLVAGFFSLFASLSFEHAYFTWIALSIFMYAGAVLITSSIGNLSVAQKLLVLIISLGFPAFTLRTLGAGQTGAMGTLILAILFVCLIKKKEFLAGVITGLFYYKPPLFVFLLAWLLMTHSKKFFYGFLCCGIPVFILSFLTIPLETFIDYIQISLNYGYGGTKDSIKMSVPYKGVGLYALLFSYLPLPLPQIKIIFFFFFLIALILLSRDRKLSLINKKENHYLTSHYILSVSLSLFLSIYILDYDLCMLIIPFILTQSNWYRDMKYTSFITGSFLLILFYIDLATPDIQRNNYTLSSLSIVFILWLLFLISQVRLHKK